MKISEPNKKLLEAAGGFYYAKRESGHNKLPPEVATYWLLGRVPIEGLHQPMPFNWSSRTQFSLFSEPSNNEKSIMDEIQINKSFILKT